MLVVFQFPTQRKIVWNKHYVGPWCIAASSLAAVKKYNNISWQSTCTIYRKWYSTVEQGLDAHKDSYTWSYSVLHLSAAYCIKFIKFELLFTHIQTLSKIIWEFCLPVWVPTTANSQMDWIPWDIIPHALLMEQNVYT